MDYASALAALYQAPLGEFVETRKRLAAALKAAGDKAGAKAFAKLARPPISAWAVNQLYWHARDAFDAFMATAARLRDGELAASGAHRDALARLRQRAAAIIGDAGHNANEATLRRTAQTLSALAVTGSFAPDLPGALADDRDPPGFAAVTGFEAPVEPAPKRHLSSVPMPASDDDDDDEARIAASRQRAADAAEREERERIAQEKREKETARARERLEKAIAIARESLEARQREVETARHQLAVAEGHANEANDKLAELESQLASL